MDESTRVVQAAWISDCRKWQTFSSKHGIESQQQRDAVERLAAQLESAVAVFCQRSKRGSARVCPAVVLLRQQRHETVLHRADRQSGKRIAGSKDPRQLH